MKVTTDTVTISELYVRQGVWVTEGQALQLKDADPNELRIQLFIDNMPATIKGKSLKYGF